MRKILVCGSIAFDNVMDFPGHFQDQIVPDKLHTINISFLVNTLKKVRGGTAPNISYNLALLGEKPVIFGSAGIDFAEYQEWLDADKAPRFVLLPEAERQRLAPAWDLPGVRGDLP